VVVQEDRLTTLYLLNLEIMGSFIGIFGLFVFIITSNNSKSILMNSYLESRNLRQTLTLDVAALVGRIILVTAGIIAAYTTTMRLTQLTQKVLGNEPLAGTLFPNIWLTVGIWTSFAGGVIALVGDYKRVQQSPRLPVQ